MNGSDQSSKNKTDTFLKNAMTQVLMENQESASGNLPSHKVFVLMASSAEFHMLLEAYG